MDAGAGGVGKCFLGQLESLAARRPSPKLNLCYVCTSKKALYHADYSPIDMKTAVGALAASTQETPDLAQLVDYLAATPAKVVMVDNTSSQKVADAYPMVLGRGISIVTPNN